MTVISLDAHRKQSRETRVDPVLAAVKSTPCSRPFLSARNVDGLVCLAIGGLETLDSPDAADEYADQIKEAAKKAREEAK